MKPGDLQFRPVYWGRDKSTRVQFEPVDSMPETEQISACMVVARHGDTIAISRPGRGWGLPGGHREQGETAEECIRREAMEEAGVELGELQMIGRWMTTKLFDSDENSQYPPLAYQLLFVAPVVRVCEYVPQLEVAERAFVLPTALEDLHHNYIDFQDVHRYILSTIGD